MNHRLLTEGIPPDQKTCSRSKADVSRRRRKTKGFGWTRSLLSLRLNEKGGRLCTPAAQSPSNESCRLCCAWSLSDPGFYFIGKPSDSASSKRNAFWERRRLLLLKPSDMREAVGYA